MQPQQNSGDKAKGVVHIVIGLLYIVVGIMVIYAQKTEFIFVGETFSYLMCGLFSLYGIFRIYRGLQRVKGKGAGW